VTVYSLQPSVDDVLDTVRRLFKRSAAKGSVEDCSIIIAKRASVLFSLSVCLMRYRRSNKFSIASGYSNSF
jgi:hypothetical protein